MTNLARYNLPQLRQLETRVKIELSRRRSEQVAKARKDIEKITRQAGIPLHHLMAGIDLPKRIVPIRYRHPTKGHLTWTGRGKTPIWVREWRNQHGNVNGLLESDRA